MSRPLFVVTIVVEDGLDGTDHGSHNPSERTSASQYRPLGWRKASCQGLDQIARNGHGTSMGSGEGTLHQQAPCSVLKPQGLGRWPDGPKQEESMEGGSLIGRYTPTSTRESCSMCVTTSQRIAWEHARDMRQNFNQRSGPDQGKTL